MRIFSGLLLVAAVACGSSTEPQGVVVHVHNPGVVHPGYVKFQIANLGHATLTTQVCRGMNAPVHYARLEPDSATGGTITVCLGILFIETDSLVPGAIVEDSVYATTAGRYRVATAWNGVAYRSAPFDVK